MNELVNCPVKSADCERISLASKSDPFASNRFDCPRCGSFILSDLRERNLVELSGLQRSVLSHRVRRANSPPAIDDNFIPKVDDRLPSPAEQANSLVLWIGNHQSSPESPASLFFPEVSAWIGTAISENDAGLYWLRKQVQVKPFLKEEVFYQEKRAQLSLTFAGWQQYEKLWRAKVDGRKAFMAMKFNEQMDSVFLCFKNAVTKTDFDLRRLTEDQPAGLIDDQLRVALRTSRFVVADLSYEGNYGAYWEAGFVEGLGP